MAFDRISGGPASSKFISTGVSGIDFLLGGGIPGGSIILLEESKLLNGCSDAIAKLFLAEGLYQKNRIYFASDGTLSCSDFLQTIPQAVVDQSDNSVDVKKSTQSENMEIAWRYDHLPVKNVQVKNEFGRQHHRFDFTKPVALNDLRTYSHLTTYDASLADRPADNKSHYNVVLSQLRRLLFGSRSSEQYHDGARWHRIFIHQCGSPLWQPTIDDSSAVGRTVDFLASLRTIVRQTRTAVALITVSTAFVDESSPLLCRMRQLADVICRLDPLHVGEKEKALLDYHGLFRCLRTPSINSIAFPVPDCSDYGFKLKKKEFLIERLHLPPDLSETVSRAQLDSFSCASSSSRSKLDF